MVLGISARSPSQAALPIVAVLCWMGHASAGQLEREQRGSTAGLRGLHNAGNGIVWASGTKGTVLRSEDDGFMWQQCSVPAEAQNLDFRGIWAWDANRAIVMSSGTGAESRLYLTVDGGAHWRMLFQNPDTKGFWDAILFLDRKQGFLLGDPVDGRFVVMRTLDGGESWTRDNSPGLRAEPKGEGAFAASNSSLVVTPGGETILFGTGGPGGSRVFFGRLAETRKWPQWNVSKAPLSSGNDASGIFALAFRDALNGIAVGGDYKSPNQQMGTAALTHDAGRTWLPSKQFPRGFRSSVAWSSETRSWIAVGPNGVDSSKDDGQTWEAAAGPDWNVLSLPWIAGPQGAIAKLRK